MKEQFERQSVGSVEYQAERLPEIDQAGFSAVQSVGGEYEGFVLGGIERRFENILVDNKIVYDFVRGQLVRVSTVTRSCGRKEPLERTSDIESFKIMVGARTLSGETLGSAASFEYSLEMLGLGRTDLHILAVALHRYAADTHQGIVAEDASRRNIDAFVEEWTRQNLTSAKRTPGE